MKVCKIDNCNKSAHYKHNGKLGYCNMHYSRLYRGVDMNKPARRSPGTYTINTKCQVIDCEKTGRINNGYCYKHYYRYRLYGDPLVNVRIPPGKYTHCTIDDCNNKHYSLKLCKLHYDRQRQSKHRKHKTAVFAKHGMLCMCCGAVANTIDHIIAKSNGGSDDAYNLQPLCMPCNSSKRDGDTCKLHNKVLSNMT